MKQFLFGFGYFSLQFIAFNELLHSDTTNFDKLFSRPSISYFLSFLCLILLNIDFLSILWKCFKFAEKIREKKDLGLNGKNDQESPISETKGNQPRLSITALTYNMVSMIKFSVFQIIIASLQFAPPFQTGSLTFLQLTFFVYYIIKYKQEKFFKSCLIFSKFVIFEGSILIFLLISLILCFAEPNSSFNADSLAWLQIISALLILISLAVEFITLVTEAVITIIQGVLFFWRKRSHKVKPLSEKNEEKKQVNPNIPSTKDKKSLEKEIKRNEKWEDKNFLDDDLKEQKDKPTKTELEIPTGSCSERSLLHPKRDPESGETNNIPKSAKAIHLKQSPFDRSRFLSQQKRKKKVKKFIKRQKGENKQNPKK